MCLPAHDVTHIFAHFFFRSSILSHLSILSSSLYFYSSFNRVDLPKFLSYYELKEKLKLAIYNTEGFDGVD